MSAALVLEGVSKRFGPVEALRNVNLSVETGERHALIGPNGSGKSTLFNLISGAFGATTGTIMLDGVPIAAGRPHRAARAGLGRSFQITRIFGGMSVRENLMLAAMSHAGRRWSLTRSGPAWRRIEEQVAELLAASPLSPHAGTLAATLSYSNQRALEICLTMATRPTVALFDEPTAGMSREETAAMVGFIRKITEGRTLLMVEHDMDVVFGLADRISVLANGEIIATGTPDRIRSDPRVQQAYLGTVPA